MSHSRNPHVALLMMVKNEEARIHVSLNSVKGCVDSCIIYDTGSTDKTIDIITGFCNKECIPLRLKKGEFVDFSVSRNVALDFADQFEEVDFLLMLDCNDELQNGPALRQICKDFLDKKEHNAFHLLQHWKFGNDSHKYYNIRLLRRGSGWRYKCKVHEYICKENATEPVIRLEGPVLFQDRNADTDGKTGRRFQRDKELLMSAHKEDPEEPRTLFYLAQTFECLNELEEGLKYYNLRTTTKQTGFVEEIFHAWLRGGKLCLRLGKGWEVASGYFMKALEFDRVEPLIPIIEYFRARNMWNIAYHFAKLACSMQYPSHCVLFIGEKDYSYLRWHLLGIVGYYVGTPESYEQGKNGCIKAIKAENQEIDKNNLLFYLKKEQELRKQAQPQAPPSNLPFAAIP